MLAVIFKAELFESQLNIATRKHFSDNLGFPPPYKSTDDRVSTEQQSFSPLLTPHGANP